MRLEEVFPSFFILGEVTLRPIKAKDPSAISKAIESIRPLEATKVRQTSFQ